MVAGDYFGWGINTVEYGQHGTVLQQRCGQNNMSIMYEWYE